MIKSKVALVVTPLDHRDIRLPILNHGITMASQLFFFDRANDTSSSLRHRLSALVLAFHRGKSSCKHVFESHRCGMFLSFWFLRAFDHSQFCSDRDSPLRCEAISILPWVLRFHICERERAVNQSNRSYWQYVWLMEHAIADANAWFLERAWTLEHFLVCIYRLH